MTLVQSTHGRHEHALLCPGPYGNAANCRKNLHAANHRPIRDSVESLKILQDRPMIVGRIYAPLVDRRYKLISPSRPDVGSVSSARNNSLITSIVSSGARPFA